LEQLRLLAPRAALPWTVCVLFYGNHPDLCERFLGSLYRYTDPAAFHLRAGLNAVCAETARMVRAAQRQHGNISITASRKNIFKCPMMRRLFHEPPVETEWIVWFDDDSHVTGPGWIRDMALAMERNPGAEFFGGLCWVDVSAKLERFIRRAQWYRDVPRMIHSEDGRPIIMFPAGGYWSIRSARIREAGWPDPRVIHFEDDYVMGEAMRQLGVGMAQCVSGVKVSDAERRMPERPISGLIHD
jgi:GT2 family glycosyltransferase